MSELDNGTTDTPNVDEQSVSNPLSMSLEELGKVDLATFEPTAEDTEEEVIPDEEEQSSEPEVETTDTEEQGSEEQTEPTEDEQEETSSTEQDKYKEELDKLYEPFTANGHEVQISSVDEAKQLIRRGIDYTKKMQALKPNLTLMKMLQNNDLLNEEKLSYLIDLDKRNPEAIAKLVKESGINPMDIDVEQESKYQANNYKPSPNEIELDNVLADVMATPTGATTTQAVNGMDEASKKILADNPNVIAEINKHVADGTYQKVMAEVSKRKLLGSLAGMSDIAAYYNVGTELQNTGAVAPPAQTPIPEQTQTTPTKVEKAAVRRERAKAAAVPPKKGTTKKAQKYDFNPMSMTSEELAKFKPDFL